MKRSIAVIGQGFVGGTLTTVFTERGATVYACDKAGKYVPAAFPVSSLIKDLVLKCESMPDFSGVYFVCVPTPMSEQGAADTSTVEDVLKEIASAPGDATRIAVIKSTVPPGSTVEWSSLYDNLTVVFNPEFLTEANALNDMRNQTRIIIGGEKTAINVVRDLYYTYFPDVPILKTTKATTAEMVKYFINLQLAVRVILSCEMAEICEALTEAGYETDYERVVEFAKYDKRLGNTHMNVPGAGGVAGARGHCFPKDMNALIAVAKLLNVKPTVLAAAWEKNLEVVKPEDRDWEKMPGRAVTSRS